MSMRWKKLTCSMLVLSREILETLSGYEKHVSIAEKVEWSSLGAAHEVLVLVRGTVASIVHIE